MKKGKQIVMHDQMGGTWLLRKKPPCATINKCIGIDQKTEKLNRCNIRRARSYEIRYCGSAQCGQEHPV